MERPEAMASAVAFFYRGGEGSCVGGRGGRLKPPTPKTPPFTRASLEFRHSPKNGTSAPEAMASAVAFFYRCGTGLCVGGRRGRLKPPTPKRPSFTRASLEFRHSPQNGTSAPEAMASAVAFF